MLLPMATLLPLVLAGWGPVPRAGIDAAHGEQRLSL
jgi:hypothetical protein